MSQALGNSPLPTTTADATTLEVRPAAVLAPLDMPVEEGAGSIHIQLEALRPHVKKIAALVAVCVLLTALYLFRLPKQFDAAAIIRVDPTATQTVVGQDQAQASPDSNILMATELAQIKTPAVVIPVISSLGLANDAGLNYTPPKNPNLSVPRVSGIPEPVLSAVLQSLSTSRPPGTFLLQIGFRARTPDLAARVANAVAEQMIRHDYETRSQALHSSSQYLTDQQKDLRARMERSQQALADYERNNDIIGSDDKSSLANQRLTAIAADLDLERQANRKLQGELALAAEKNVDALIVSGRGDSLRPLVDAIHAEELQFAAISAKYGIEDPQYREAQRRLAGYQTALDSAVGHVANQIKDEADAQRVQADLTEADYQAQKKDLEDFNSKLAEYNLLKQQADSEGKLYDDMLQRIQQADVSAGYHSNNLRIVEEAVPSSIIAYPKIGLSLLIAFLFSTILGVGVALIGTTFDRTLSGPSSVLAATGERLIGSLPMETNAGRLRALVRPSDLTPSMRSERKSPYAEAIYSLRTSLFLSANGGLSSLAVTSAQPREGKTTTTVNLAAASARNGYETVLVDADLRRPEVNRVLGLSNRFGLTSYFHGQVPLSEIMTGCEVPGLTVIPAGPAVTNSSELLTANIGALLEELKSRFKLVIVDCPPTLGFADSMIIGPTVDAVIVVARAGSTPREYVRATIEQLRNVRANVAGVVLNAVSAQANQYYNYYSGYHRYYDHGDDEVSSKSAS